MTCEEFLPALETGDALEQQAAREHAAGCPRCAAAAAALAAFKATLARHEPLSESARQVWENASQTATPESTRRRWAPAMAGFLAAAAACLMVSILVTSRHDNNRGNQITDRSGTSAAVIEHDPAVEFAELVNALDMLDGNLVALAERAERLEIEREITLTLNQYNRW